LYGPHQHVAYAAERPRMKGGRGLIMIPFGAFAGIIPVSMSRVVLVISIVVLFSNSERDRDVQIRLAFSREC